MGILRDGVGGEFAKWGVHSVHGFGFSGCVRVIALAENRAADAHHGCAAFDGKHHVAAHAHGQGVGLRRDGLQLGKQAAHLAELLAQLAGVVGVAGDAHETAQVEAGQGGDGLGEGE